MKSHCNKGQIRTQCASTKLASIAPLTSVGATRLLENLPHDTPTCLMSHNRSSGRGAG
jgi:hypothetical protein